ncbi:MAG: pro-sigmaK processing inhibitor BofA family protein [Bacilli bacterium]|nr:pro-sigmaK processing inhibitor BofA family protein [Bacilli bacterium]
MLKILFKIIKRIVISSFLLYGYNLLVQPIGLIIPINVFTVGALSILGVPALLCLIFIMVLIY